MEQGMRSEAELVESGAVRRRRWRTVEEKRRIVEATLIEGASVSQVARLHGVNTDQVFHWRRQYHAGDLSSRSIAQRTFCRFLSLKRPSHAKRSQARSQPSVPVVRSTSSFQAEPW